MEDSSRVKIYDFMPTINEVSNLPVSLKLRNMAYDGEYFLFGGYSNYLPEDVAISNVEVNWTGTSKHYGFF